MITATLERFIDFPGTENYNLYRFSVPSIPASTISDDILFAMHTPAKLENLRVVCNSRNYSLSLRLESGVTVPSIEEVYSVIQVSQSYHDDRLEVFFSKDITDIPNKDKLYGVIKNMDGANATGIVYFEFVIIAF
jgi:hypothetical protein